jgi:hypothetical protein
MHGQRRIMDEAGALYWGLIAESTIVAGSQ